MVKGLMLGVVLFGGTVATAAAQGSVTGQVTIRERDNVPASDLVNAVIYLQPAGARGDAGRIADTTPAEVALQGRTFVPRVRVVGAGSRVVFPNRDSFNHNVFSNTGAAEFDLGVYGRGASREAAFPRGGVYPVYCNVHARMIGYVVALDTPHHAQPGIDGRFSIAQVPAGRYRLVVWHERTPMVTREIVVTPRGLDVSNVELDASGYKRVQHRNKFGKDYASKRGDRY